MAHIIFIKTFNKYCLNKRDFSCQIEYIIYSNITLVRKLLANQIGKSN